ncbi:MAG TPA: type II toxin-antitoxin system VapC family toxin [Chloroflexota bacterium]|nr:type II toxin-antitoxin system VapC family toxin [Chloroflexota bacterium]
MTEGAAHSPCVVDASALLALAHNEPGADIVLSRLAGAAISAVNWSEVVQKSIARGADVDGLREEYVDLGLTIHPFGSADAETAAYIWEQTKGRGLSLADRVCLSLARTLRLPVLTSDRAWASLNLGVTVQLIR